MTGKKLPSQASYEELLAALTESEEETQDEAPEADEVLEFSNNVVPFLSHYQIIPGEFPVTKSLLYKLYRMYSIDPVPQLVFHRIVGEYLPKYSNRSGRFYRINIDQFKISNEIFKLHQKPKVDKVKSPKWRKRFEAFLKEKNITAGDFWVAGFVIYEIYLDFNRERKKKPVFSYESFHGMLKEYFKNQRKTSNRSLWFKVNETPATYFNREQLNEIQARRSKKKG
jgi:hypothetical protein